jgi:hypothetical protein
MKGESDFRMFVPQQNDYDKSLDLQSVSSCVLIKAFGDLETGEYALFRSESSFEIYATLMNWLTGFLERDMLMIGFDPLWDRPIKTLFPPQGQSLWYVNEEANDSIAASLLLERKSMSILEDGGSGSYKQFIHELYQCLMSENTLYRQFGRNYLMHTPNHPEYFPVPGNKSDSMVSSSLQRIIQEISISTYNDVRVQRKRIFIGYSQKDKKHLLQLKAHLAIYEQDNLLDVWDDTKITAGSQWYEEIQKTLNITRIAILLISADFLASRFLAENVLPPLLRSAKIGGATILPVILHYCVFEDTSLAQFQPFNSPSKPFTAMKLTDKHKIWADLVRHVITLVNDV